METTPIEVAELILIFAVRQLLPTPTPTPTQEYLPEGILEDEVDTAMPAAAAKSILDALPFSAAPWIRITAHNHIPTLSIDHVAAQPGNLILSVIDAYLHLTSTPANAHRRRISHAAIDNASAIGHTQTLDLLLAHLGAASLPYSTLAIDLASAAGHTHVLDWWLASAIRPLKYTHHALTDASIEGHLPVMNWWKTSGIVCLYDIFRVLRSASRHGKVQVLQWYREFLAGNIYCPPGVMEEAAARGDVGVLAWWTHESGVPLLYKHAMDAATKHGRVEVLRWFVERGPRPLLFSVKVVNEVVDPCVQMWWKQSGLLESVSSVIEE